MQDSRGQYAISDDGSLCFIPEPIAGYEPDSESVIPTADLTGVRVSRRKNDPTQEVILTIVIGQLSFSHLALPKIIPNDLITLYMEDFFWENDFHPQNVIVSDEFTITFTLTRLDGTSFTKSELNWLYKGLKEQAKDRYNFKLSVTQRNEQEALIYEG